MTHAAMARAVSAGLVMACGVRITTMASTESSSWAAFTAIDVALGVGVAQHVDRVADAGGGGQLLAQGGGGAAGERADLHAATARRRRPP